MMIRWTQLITAAGACLIAWPAVADEEDAGKLAFFENRIRPVLVEHCYSCHSANAEVVKGGLLLDTRQGLLVGGDSGAALVPGKAEESLLLDAMRHDGLEMPPDRKLPDDVIAAPGIPHTRTGKKLEVPLTGIMSGHADVSLDPRAIDHPDLIDWYREQGRAHRW